MMIDNSPEIWERLFNIWPQNQQVNPPGSWCSSQEKEAHGSREYFNKVAIATPTIIVTLEKELWNSLQGSYPFPSVALSTSCITVFTRWGEHFHITLRISPSTFMHGSSTLLARKRILKVLKYWAAWILGFETCQNKVVDSFHGIRQRWDTLG